MSNDPSLTRQPSRRPSNAYIDGSWVDFDFTASPSLPFRLNERVGVDPWLWSLPERNLTSPSSMISLPRPRMRLVVFRTNVPNNTNMRSRPTQPPQQQHSELTPNQQINALKKLKKQIFNPTPKKIIKRLGRFYRQNDAAGNQKTDKKLEEDDDDDDKKCVVCLEYFEPKEAVMVTPCNHMFHEDCILPWIRSNGKCPVCRFSFCDDSGSSSTSDGNLVDDRLTNDVLSFVT